MEEGSKGVGGRATDYLMTSEGKETRGGIRGSPAWGGESRRWGVRWAGATHSQERLPTKRYYF